MTFVGLLSLAPLIAFILILLAPESQARIAALLLSLVIFAASLGLLAGGLPETNLPWIPAANIHYHVGADGLSVWLVLLTTFLTPLAVLISWNHIRQRLKAYYSLLLLLEFGLVGVFLALDLFVFFVFWEVSLVPMYFLIGVWGHERRIYAAVKFFLYTMAGSALMLVGIVYIYTRTQTFDYPAILQLMDSGRFALNPGQQMLLFLAFFLAFAIKVPLFPFHTWLPDAHVEAPTAGSVMLAAVMLKMGTYGLVRFCLPMFPSAARRCAGWIAVLAIIGILYGALVAMVQPNMKKLVAYSSVSHLGFAVLGIFSFTRAGLDGAVFQMLAHGISTGALFTLVGMLYERRHSLEIADYGGVATPAPCLATVFVITSFASAGLPLLSNFVGEFLVMQGAAQVDFRWAVFSALGVILSACYLLWLCQRIFYGETPESLKSHMPDLSGREWAAMIPLLILMVWLGAGSQTFLPRIGVVTGPILNETTVNVPFQVMAPAHVGRDFILPADFQSVVPRWCASGEGAVGNRPAGWNPDPRDWPFRRGVGPAIFSPMGLGPTYRDGDSETGRSPGQPSTQVIKAILLGSSTVAASPLSSELEEISRDNYSWSSTARSQQDCWLAGRIAGPTPARQSAALRALNAD